MAVPLVKLAAELANQTIFAMMIAGKEHFSRKTFAI
jgi:hypothetical protein